MKRNCLLTVGLIAVLTLTAYSQQLSLSHLTTDYTINPIGTDNPKPGFGWKLSANARNTRQTAYELRVGLNENSLQKGRDVIWSTGKINNDQSVHILYDGPGLTSRQRYYWQVRVWDNHGHTSLWSQVNFWETGLYNKTDWSAKWIETAEQTNGAVGPVPVFNKSFVVTSQIRSARLYITAHGLYEAKLNGKVIGDHLLTPGWTSYHKRLQYQVYDVTTLLKRGENATEVAVGDGWYRGFLEWNKKRNFYGKEVGLLYQLEILYNDGKKQTVNSDGTWSASFDGPIRSADIYHGETIDTRLSKNISDDKRKEVRVVDYALGNLVAQGGPPVTAHEEFHPVKFITTPRGETVIDFGQNLVGWVKLNVKGNAGDTIHVEHAEVLDKEGNFYTANLRGARQENKYVLDGTEQELFPHFTFQGFRYAKITGYRGVPDKNNFTAVAIYSDMQQAGSFTTSDSLVNQLQHNIQWGQKGNFVDIPTDCPQRDERLGWTGDAQVFFNTAAFNMDVACFFSKWLLDLKADQYENGRVPSVIPVTQKRANDGSAGWADVATIIPWNFYLAYGDKQLLARQYESMKAWVEYVHGVSKNNLWNSGSHYGDWLFYTMADDRDGKAAITDKYLIAQVFYAASTQNLINAAGVFGKAGDVNLYNTLLTEIKAAFNREYVTPSGKLVSNSQTAYALALNFEMLPESLREQAAKRLVDNITSYKDHLTTGFLGTPYLCHVLTRYGYTDIAYKLLLQDTYPSWLYPVKMGATTIWERWDGIKTDSTFQTTSMNSFNHYAYGAIGDWMYKVIAGINQDSSAAGYKRIIIAPQPGGKMKFASGVLETLYGKVQSSWKIEDQYLELDLVIPANTSAIVILPAAASAAVTESGVAIEQVKDIQRADQPGAAIRLQVGSGEYHFKYKWSGN